MTADGKQAWDILGFLEEDIKFSHRKIEKMMILIFKNAKKSLLGRDVLATHPDTK